MKQHTVIELLTAENVPLIDMHWKMEVVYGEDCVDISTRWCWAASVCDGKQKHVSLNLNDRTEWKAMNCN
jgi:hypothetical protein